MTADEQITLWLAQLRAAGRGVLVARLVIAAAGIVALVVVHLAAAFAGQMPSYARVHRAALRRWWLPGAIAVVLTPAVAVATALIRGADVPGSLLVTVAAITLTATTIWFAAGQKLGRD